CRLAQPTPTLAHAVASLAVDQSNPPADSPLIMFQPKPLPTFPLPPPTAPDRRLVSYLPVSGRLARASGARAVRAAPVRRRRYPDDIVRHPVVFGIEATVLFLTCSIAACEETFKTEADRDHHLFTAHRVWGHNCPVEGCEFNFYSRCEHIRTHNATD